MYYNGSYRYDAADGERTGIAHEYLCRIGVIPQEAYETSDEGAEEYHQLLRLRYIHYIKV